MTTSPNRLVAMLTPIVFAPLAGSIAVLAARYFPGVDVDQGSLQAIFIAGATIAFGKAALWLKGWQDWEKREAEAPADDVELPPAGDDLTAFADEPSFEEDPMFADDAATNGDLGFDDRDLDDVMTAPVAGDDEGSA